MAKQIKPEDLFDFDAYERRINQMSQLNERFEKTGIEMANHIKEAQKPLLEQIQKYIDTIEKVNVSSNKNLDTLVKLEKESQEYTTVLERQRKLENILGESYDATTKSITELKSSLAILRTEYEKLNPSQKDYKQQQEAIAQKTKELKTSIEAQLNTLKGANSIVKTVANSYASLSKETNELRNRLKNLPDAFDKTSGAINKANKEAAELQRQIQQNDRVLKNFDASIGLNQRNVGNYSSALVGVGKNLGGVGLALVGLDSGIAVLQKLYTVIQEFGRLDIVLQNVTKTTAEFNQAQDLVVAIANKNGQNIQVLTQQYAGLVAASRGTKLEGIETQKIFLALSNSAASLQMSNEDLAGAFKAITDIMSKGSIQAEELKGQLGDRLYGAFNNMAKAIGVTTAELNDMLKEGKVTTEMLSKFADELNKLYGDKAKRNLESINGSWEYMTTQISLIIKSLSDTSGVQSFFSSIYNGIGDTMRAVKLLINSEEWGKLAMYGASRFLHFKTDIVEEVNGLVQADKFIENEVLKYISANADKRAQILDKSQIALGYLKDQIKKLNEEKDSFTKIGAFVDRDEYEKVTKQIGILTKGVNMYESLLKKLNEIPGLSTNENTSTGEDKDKNKLNGLEKIEKRIAELNDILADQITLQMQGKKYDDAKILSAAAELKIQTELVEKIKEEIEIRTKGEKRVYEPVLPENFDLSIRSNLQKQGKVNNVSPDSKYDVQAGAITSLAFDALRGTTDISKINDIEKNAILDLEELKLKATTKGQKKRIELIKEEFKIRSEKYEQDVKDYQQNEDKKKELLQKFMEVDSQLANASFDFLTSLRQYDIETLQAQKEHELSLVGDNADAKTAIEKKYANEILEIRRKQARMEKAQAVFNIGLNTAQAIMGYLKNPGGIPGIALSIAAGITGAIQLATVLAKPLPQFFKGTDNAPEGLAWVAEKGPELRESKGKTYYYDKPQITWLNAGDKIHTAHETSKMLAHAKIHEDLKIAAEQSRMLEIKVTNQGQAPGLHNTSGIEAAIRESFAQLPIHTTVLEKDGFTEYVQTQNSRTKYSKSKYQLPKK